MLDEVGEIFVSRESEAGGGAIDHGVHWVRARPAPRRHHEDDENLDDLLGRRDADDRMQRLGEPRVLRNREQVCQRLPHQAEQRNAGGAEQEGGPHPGGRAGPFAGGDHEPQDQQRRRDRRGADDGGEGLEQEHQGRYVIFLGTSP
jgi:hypothetical protein